MGDQLPIVSINDKRGADNVTVPTRELKAVRAPSQVRTHDDDFAVMDTAVTTSRRFAQQQTMSLHEPIDALVVRQGFVDAR